MGCAEGLRNWDFRAWGLDVEWDVSVRNKPSCQDMGMYCKSFITTLHRLLVLHLHLRLYSRKYMRKLLGYISEKP